VAVPLQLLPPARRAQGTGFKQAWKALSFGDRLKININFFALFFGAIYLFILGMWRKALVVIGINIALAIVTMFLPDVVARMLFIAMNLLVASSTNYSYYLEQVKGAPAGTLRRHVLKPSAAALRPACAADRRPALAGRLHVRARIRPRGGRGHRLGLQAEARDRHRQLLGLLFHRTRGGTGFFHQRGVLLGGLVHLHHGLVDLLDARRLLARGGRDLGHDLVDAPTWPTISCMVRPAPCTSCAPAPTCATERRSAP
jgi:hypothetical protein